MTKLDDRLVRLLALDEWLVAYDKGHGETLTQEQYDFIQMKIYESYGLTVTSGEKELEDVRERVKSDMRDEYQKLWNELEEEDRIRKQGK